MAVKRTKPFAIAVMGPTASGKTLVAEVLAERLGARIINADAFQAYKRLSVGTDKPTNRGRYELLDFLEPWEVYSVGKFVSLAWPICASEAEAGRNVVVCGGTGLYVRALFEGFKGLHEKPEPGERRRLEGLLKTLGPEGLAREEGIEPGEIPAQIMHNPRHLVRYFERRKLPRSMSFEQEWGARKLKFGLLLSVERRIERIERRLDAMMQNGWLEEVRALRAIGASGEWPAMKAIGYGTLLRHLDGELTLGEAKAEILAKMRQYAKRQMTWLRREPSLIWVEADAEPGIVADRIIGCIDREEISANG